MLIISVLDNRKKLEEAKEKISKLEKQLNKN